jgi:hypothetical protein
MVLERLGVSTKQIADFCSKWKVREFAIFGSALRDDFASHSDVDVLVEMSPDSELGWDVVDMEQELSSILGRRVDLVFKEGLRNPYRRTEILKTRQILYAA